MKKKLIPGFLVLALLSCNYVTQMIVPPTATPLPTIMPTITASPTVTPVPLAAAYIPPECASAPIATLAPDTFAEPTPEPNAEIEQSEQLRIVREVGDIVQDIYVYPDFNGKDWSAIEERYRDKVYAGLDTESFYSEMQNMITELGDEHSFFLTPLEVQQSEDELQGDLEFVGVGIYGSVDYDRGRVHVVATYPGSSAEQAGILPHDSILAADDLPVFDEDFNRLRGPECSAVVATVQSPGQEPRKVVLIRHSIEGNVRIESRLVPTNDGSKIGYIFIPSFFDETIPPQIEDALNAFGPLDGLILDVRMNGGGSSHIAHPVLSFFTSGTLGEFVSRFESRTLQVDADPVQNSQSVPLVVMVNEDTASYGEIFAGIMRDSRGAKITGETSLGNVEVLHGYDFNDGSQLWIASETFHPAHSDENWEQTGIVTDIEAYAPWDTFTFETDPSLAAALSLLGHQ